MSKRSRGHHRRAMLAWFPDEDYRRALEGCNRSVIRGAPDALAHAALEQERNRGGKT